MYTQSNAYVKKFSSGTIIALLAFSGLLFLIPLTATVHAANAAPPSISYVSPTVWSGAAGDNPEWVEYTVMNPASNQFALTGFVLTAPSGWTIVDCDWFTSFLDTCAFSASAASYAVGGGAPIPPGGSQTLEVEVIFATGTYPITGTFTSTVQDASSAGYYSGPTFKLTSVDTTTAITLSPDTGTAFTAGSSPISFTVTISPAYSGLQIYLASSAGTGTFSSNIVELGATGSASFTFTPSNLDGATTVTAYLGNPYSSAGTLYDWWTSDSDVVTTTAAAPGSVAFCLGACPTVPFPSTHYVGGIDHIALAGVNYANIAGSTIFFTVADKFGNPDSAGVVGPSTTFTALSGGGFFDATTTTSSVVQAVASGALTHEYSQSGQFETIGLISATVSGTYGGSPFTVSGSTGRIFTSTFDVASNLPTIDPTTVIAEGTGSCPAGPSPCQQAGGKATVDFQLTTVQQGVPVELSVDPTSTAVNNDGAFSGSSHITVYTSSTGLATAAYSVDTGATAIGVFNANVSAPTDANPTGSASYLGTSGPSIAANQVVTIAGTPAEFVLAVCFVTALPPCAAANTVGTSAVNGTSVYVDVSISDKFGNPSTNPGPSQIQISLSASGSVLAASTVYINAHGSDTYSGFGWIAWTLPATVGTKLTLAATGVLSGKSVSTTFSLTTVSELPTLAVTSPAPLAGVIYSSSTTVVFDGQANASIGYPPSVTITSVGYKIGTGAWQSAVIVPGNQIIWSVAANFASGLNTIQFNATDSNTNTALSTKYTVLIDTSAPAITFTTSNNAVLNYSQPVLAKIVEAEGDLNATSVSATYNGTAVSSSNIAITPSTNTLGSSVTYQVSIKNLPAGTWDLVLSASGLSGLSSTTGITVTVQVSFAASIIINSATKSTLGSFTGISVSATNLWTTSQNLVVFAVWKNGAGQTVAVSTGGLTLAAGATGTAFAPIAGGLPSGSYSVTVFAITTGNNPVSSTTSISASV